MSAVSTIPNAQWLRVSHGKPWPRRWELRDQGGSRLLRAALEVDVGNGWTTWSGVVPTGHAMTETRISGADTLGYAKTRRVAIAVIEAVIRARQEALR